MTSEVPIACLDVAGVLSSPGAATGRWGSSDANLRETLGKQRGKVGKLPDIDERLEEVLTG